MDEGDSAGPSQQEWSEAERSGDLGVAGDAEHVELRFAWPHDVARYGSKLNSSSEIESPTESLSASTAQTKRSWNRSW